MNTEAMKKNFEKIAATEYTNPVDNVLSFGTYKEGEYDYAGVQSSWVCYQQAVKDMETPEGFQMISEEAISYLFKNHPEAYKGFYERVDEDES